MPAGQWQYEVLLSARGQPPESTRDAVPVLPPVPVSSAPGRPEQSPRGPARGWPSCAFCSGLVLHAATLRVFCTSVSQPFARLPDCVLPAALSILLPAPRVARPFPTPARAAARGRLQVSVRGFCSPLRLPKSAGCPTCVDFPKRRKIHTSEKENQNAHEIMCLCVIR